MVITLDSIDLKDLGIGDYLSIDPEISDLVKAINIFGIKTTASCQGHLNRGHPFPWVGIWPPYNPKYNDKRLEEFYRLIEKYNSQNCANWIFEKTWLHPKIESKSKEELKELQEDTKRLAVYIVSNIYQS
ncbi:MAG: hypothetical protein AABY07_07930 [Nanoarchaeota archaeon]